MTKKADLEKRFNQVNLATKTQIQQLTTTQLEKLAEALLDFTSVEGLDTWLSNVN